MPRRRRQRNKELGNRVCEVNRYGRPLKGMGQRSAGLESGSLAMPRMLNLTKHSINDVLDYPVEGYIERFTLIEPVHDDKTTIISYHDFNDALPTWDAVLARARGITNVAMQYSCRFAWIGGSPYLVAALADSLQKCGIISVWSWSERSYAEYMDADSGKVRVEMFRRHAGWVIMDSRYKDGVPVSEGLTPSEICDII